MVVDLCHLKMPLSEKKKKKKKKKNMRTFEPASGSWINV